MPVSIYDIAEVANVAPSTVSRALQGHPRVGKKTTEYIRRLAKEMGYIPSAVARSLTAQRTHTIGMIMATISDPFMGQVVEGVEGVAAQLGYDVFLSITRNDLMRELEIVGAFQERRVDGLIIVASHLVSHYTRTLQEISLPVVMINEQEESDKIATVSVDDAESAFLAVSYLASLGHRRIGYVGVGNRPKSNTYRLRGYKEALEAAQISFDPRLVYASELDEHLARGKASLNQLLEAQATAIFCYNDMTAIGVMAACRENNIRIPRDLSIVGFDDIEIAQYAAPPLTTIHQPRQLLGQRAMEIIHKLLNGEVVSSEIIKGELVVRETTSRPT
jgi:LacI family transcriptional regulator/LacI family repressor for deo operon, udp, cdd, tsx, nupC, and nupG